MGAWSDEHNLSEVLSEFARTLGTDFDIQAILDHLVTQIVDVLPITAAGVTLISSPGARPHYLAASNTSALLFEELQTDLSEGPCLAAYRTGQAVAVADLATDTRFPRFGPRAAQLGLGAVFAFPLRHASGQLGALDLYRDVPGVLAVDDLAAAQTLADVTTAYLLNARARVEAQDSERLYRSIVETAEEGIWIHDLDGTTTFANPKMAALLKSTPDALRGTSLFDFIEAADRVAASAQLADRRSGGSDQFEFALCPSDGSSIAVMIVDTPLRDVDGSVAAVLKMVTDITARKHAEADSALLDSQREQTDRMASLGQLAGGIAHDFNNLLGVIANYATLINRQVDLPQVAADLNEIDNATRGAAALTKQLLAFAREEQVAPTLVDVNSALRRFSQLLTRTLGEQIELRLRLNDNQPEGLIVLVDPNQFEQVLLNLAINARDAMPTGGLLTMMTDLVSDGASHQARGEWVRIRISDTGQGMPPEVAARAFEPFFTTKPRETGTGLGLATCYGIVTQDHGEIRIDSEVGRGTTIQILLPSHSAAISEREVRAESVPDGNETILLVEDADALRLAMARNLTASGYNVITASDGDEALQLLVSTDLEVDVVITDMIMKRVSGAELGRELAVLRPNLPVIYMSGYASPTTNQPAGPVVEKPVSQQVLLAAIRNALRPQPATPTPRRST
jgi:PAS domain S-box-containing protein